MLFPSQTRLAGQASDGRLVSPAMKPHPGQPGGSEPPETPRTDRPPPWAPVLGKCTDHLSAFPPSTSTRHAHWDTEERWDTPRPPACEHRGPMTTGSPLPPLWQQPQTVPAQLTWPFPHTLAPPTPLPSPNQPGGLGQRGRIASECLGRAHLPLCSSPLEHPWSRPPSNLTLSARYKLGCDSDQGSPLPDPEWVQCGVCGQASECMVTG